MLPMRRFCACAVGSLSPALCRLVYGPWALAPAAWRKPRPRFESLVVLYGAAETRKLIAGARVGDLVRGDAAFQA